MKEKKREEDEKKNDGEEFYYELVGILLILLSVIIFSELGAVGQVLKLFLKVFFGDWYFVVTFFVLFVGIYTTMKRRFLNYKSHRIVGFYIFVVSALTISHYPLSVYIKTFSDNQIIGTWQLFVEYLKNYSDDLSMGGGLIGAVGFYLFSFLLGELGVFLISFVLILVSICFIFERSILDIFRASSSNAKGVFHWVRGVDKFLRTPNIKKRNTSRISRRLPLTILENKTPNKDLYLQNNIAIENTTLMKKILRHNKIGAEVSNVTVGNITTKYIIKILSNHFNKNIREIFQEVFVTEFYLKQKDYLLEIEMVNKYKNYIGLKDILNNNKFLRDDYTIPLGIDVDNNKHYLSLNDVNTIFLVKSNIDVYEQIINSLYFKYSSDKCSIYIYESIDSNTLVSSNLYKYNDTEDFLISLEESINKRLDKQHEKNSKEHKKFYFLRDFHLIRSESLEIELKKYISLLKGLGVYLIICSDEEVYVEGNFFKHIDLLLLGKINNSFSNHMTGTNILTTLDEQELISIYKGSNKRFQTVNVSNLERKKLNKSVINY